MQQTHLNCLRDENRIQQINSTLIYIDDCGSRNKLRFIYFFSSNDWKGNRCFIIHDNNKNESITSEEQIFVWRLHLCLRLRLGLRSHSHFHFVFSFLLILFELDLCVRNECKLTIVQLLLLSILFKL